jgi:serine phosphatase RsbU (regulator of sigma subunit)
MDPLRFKHLLIQLLKFLILIELIGALVEGINTGNWTRFGVDLVIAGILYVTWERLRVILTTSKEDARLKMETSTQEVRLWDALVFSLLWSDEIYSDIPADRRRLVVISYTLIAVGVGVAYVNIGFGLMQVVLAGGLVLAAVNLVAWIVGAEREEKDTLRTELSLAHEVQMSLMPREKPRVPGYDIDGFTAPARDVGGDLFDFTCLGDCQGWLGLSVVDVSGKGIQAAMAATFTSGAYASEAKLSTSPGQILTRLNRAVYAHSRRGHFVAFLMAALDTERRMLAFANAGQTKPLLRRNGTVRWLDAVGVHFPLGMKEDSVYDEYTVALERGDILVLLTDGFTEAMDAQQDAFGTERMERVLADPAIDSMGAGDMIAHVTTAVRTHAGAAPQHDDMTMVVLKVL